MFGDPANPGKFSGALAKNILGTRKPPKPDFRKPPKPGYPSLGRMMATAKQAAKNSK